MITIKCKVCGREFEFTDGEMEFYKDRNLNEPKRCKDCRRKRIPQENVEGVERHENFFYNSATKAE